MNIATMQGVLVISILLVIVALIGVNIFGPPSGVTIQIEEAGLIGALIAALSGDRRLLFQKGLTMAKMEHTLHSVGETVERHFREFRAFAGKAESKADEGLEWWKKSHWSALIGLVLLLAAMVVGDILGIASLF